MAHSVEEREREKGSTSLLHLPLHRLRADVVYRAQEEEQKDCPAALSLSSHLPPSYFLLSCPDGSPSAHSRSGKGRNGGERHYWKEDERVGSTKIFFHFHPLTARKERRRRRKKTFSPPLVLPMANMNPPPRSLAQLVQGPRGGERGTKTRGLRPTRPHLDDPLVICADLRRVPWVVSPGSGLHSAPSLVMKVPVFALARMYTSYGNKL